MIEEYNESVKFVKELDINKIKKKMNSFINSEINENILIQSQINNKENYLKINKQIEENCNIILNEKCKRKDLIIIIASLGINIKNKIIYEIYHEPNKFIKLKLLEKENKKPALFFERLFSNLFINNDITVAIKKKEDDIKQTLTLIYLILSGEIFKKIISISYDFGEERNLLILTNEEEINNLIKLKRKEYSIALKIPEKKIQMTNLRFGSITFDIIINFNSNIYNIVNQLKKDKEAYHVKCKSLIEGCIISERMFDQYDKYANLEEDEKGILLSFLKNYVSSPLKLKNCDLMLIGLYDNDKYSWSDYNNDENNWIYIYYKTDKLNNSKNHSNNLKISYNKVYLLNVNPKETNEFFKYCEKTIYLSSLISDAEYFSDIKRGIYFGKKKDLFLFIQIIKISFQNIENLDKFNIKEIITTNKNNKVENDVKISEEIGFYRILLKKINQEEEEEEEEEEKKKEEEEEEEEEENNS